MKYIFCKRPNMMAIYGSIFAALAISLSLSANSTELQVDQKIAELTTKSGETYKNVVIRKIEKHGLSIFHESGATTISADELPEYRENFASDEEIRLIRDAAHKAEEAWHRDQTVELPEITAKKNDAQNHTKPTPDKKKYSEAALFAKTIGSSRKELNTSSILWIDESLEEIISESTKQLSQSRLLEVQITNKGQNPNLVLEVFWLGYPLNNKNKKFINSISAKKINIRPGEKSIFTVSSNFRYIEGDLLYLRRDSAGSDYWSGYYIQTWSGYTYAGWVARVSDGYGNVLGIQGARPPLCNFANEFRPPILNEENSP
jgi:hypothetical protein